MTVPSREPSSTTMRAMLEEVVGGAFRRVLRDAHAAGRYDAELLGQAGLTEDMLVDLFLQATRLLPGEISERAAAHSTPTATP